MSGIDPQGPPRRVAPPTVTGLASVTYEPPPAPDDSAPPSPAGGGGGGPRQSLVIAGVVVAIVVLLGVGLLLRSSRDHTAAQTDDPDVQAVAETQTPEATP